ncbi:MAG: endolytic transglycosylase MltG [Bdellovibrionales bacterium]|nr:endolytic transglycosylase MltG [Bdellovibrionales bacterium]
MSKRFVLRFFATLGSIGLYLVPFLAGAILVFWWFNSNLLSPVAPGSDEVVLYEVKEGEDLPTISEGLQARELLRNAWSVVFLSKLRSDSGEKLSFVAGEYSLSPGQTPNEILDTLLSGKTVQHALELGECLTVRDVARVIGQANLVSESEAFEALRDQHTLARLGIPAYLPEGYLFAGSYSFSKPIRGEQVVAKIVTEGQKRLDDQLPGWKARAGEIKFRPYEVLILASLLEKEGATEAERKIISSLYHNRLRVGMPLQSEAALRYSLPADQQFVTNEDINSQGPYNLYLNTGLPPTPVCSPSFGSIRAALYPDDTDYLYMVRRDDGTLDYSETIKEHQEKLDAYNAGGPSADAQRIELLP